MIGPAQLELLSARSISEASEHATTGLVCRVVKPISNLSAKAMELSAGFGDHLDRRK